MKWGKYYIIILCLLLGVLFKVNSLILANDTNYLVTEPINTPVTGLNIDICTHENIVCGDWKPFNIKDYITEQAILNGINPETALRIADCESDFIPTAKNKHSTAKGIYQFINETWNNYCVGDVYDAKSNIDCFMKYYLNNPQWWECK